MSETSISEFNWTPELDAKISQGFEAGLSAQLIADEIGVTRNAVLGRAYRQRLSVAPGELRVPAKVAKAQARASEREKHSERIKDLRELGFSWAEIGRILNVDINTARLWAIEAGILIPKSQIRFTDADRAYISDAWAKNVPVEVIAETLGRSFGVIRQEIHRLKQSGVVESRDAAKTRLLKTYGEAALEAGATPSEALRNLAEAKMLAFAAGIERAREAKEKFRNDAITEMRAALAAGTDRNAAIFEARSKGVKLEQLGQEFGVTRERIRQICNAHAGVIALKDLARS